MHEKPRPRFDIRLCSRPSVDARPKCLHHEPCLNTVSVIATATNTAIGSPIPVGLSPLGVAVTPDRSKGYVTNHGANTVSVIHTATNSVSATIPVGASPFGVAVTPDGTKVYVARSPRRGGHFGGARRPHTVSVIGAVTHPGVAT